MKPDPTTKEGQEAIRKIMESRKTEAEEARRRSEEEIDDESTGKLTVPSELDILRDRRNNDDRKE